MNSENKLNNEKEENNNPIIKKNQFENLKSNFIFKRIFTYLHKRKLLEIIKYNKKMQKKLNINNNNYKEAMKIYSSIEVEIIPIENKYDFFIITDYEDERYYHIYFNNNKQEMKRTYLKKSDKISNIKIKIDYQIISLNKLFSNIKCIKSINFKKFYRNNIINMSRIFYKCSSLKELNLSNFNTDHVTNMSYMFYECSSLTMLNLSNFNISHVTNMNYMFYGCSSLKELNISNFNLKNVINMKSMFYGCSKELINKIKTKFKHIKECAFIDFFVDENTFY